MLNYPLLLGPCTVPLVELVCAFISLHLFNYMSKFVEKIVSLYSNPTEQRIKNLSFGYISKDNVIMSNLLIIKYLYLKVF